MPTLTITVGLPGAGKTTYARAWVAEDPMTRSRINRDDLGLQLHGRRFYGQPELSAATEETITLVQLGQLRTLLLMGRDVICDDTNLNPANRDRLAGVARDHGADVNVVDMLNVPLGTVLSRNAERAGTPAFVPEQVIRGMWGRYVAHRAVA